MNQIWLKSTDWVYWPDGLQFHMQVKTFILLYYFILIVSQIFPILYSYNIAVNLYVVRRITSAICVACVLAPNITRIYTRKYNRIALAAYLLVVTLFSIVELIDVISSVELNTSNISEYMAYKFSIVVKIINYILLLNIIKTMRKLESISDIQKELCVRKLIGISKLDENCCICLEQLSDNVQQTPCGHKYHLTCISKWFETSSLCPYCRSSIVSREEQKQELSEIIPIN